MKTEIARILDWDHELPVVECRKATAGLPSFVFTCPWCGGEHSHGAVEGHRLSHCSHEDAPEAYILRLEKSCK